MTHCLALDVLQAVHHLVATATEVAVQQRVLGEQLVVLRGRLFVRRVGVRDLLAHRRRGRVHVAVPGRHRTVDRRTERAGVARVGQRQRLAGHVGVHLHQELVLQQTARRNHLGDLDTVGGERLDDRPEAEGGRLEQRPVLILRVVGQRLADHQAGQVGVDQDGPVAVVPVERDQAVLANVLLLGLLGEQLVQRDAPAVRLVLVGLRHAVLDEPGEDVAHRGLASFEAPGALDQAAVDDTEHGVRHLAQLGTGDHVHRRSAEAGGELTVLDALHGRGGDVRVDVADRHRGARLPDRPRSRPRR